MRWGASSTRTRQNVSFRLTSSLLIHPVLPLGRTGRATFSQSVPWPCSTRKTRTTFSVLGLESWVLGAGASGASYTPIVWSSGRTSATTRKGTAVVVVVVGGGAGALNLRRSTLPHPANPKATSTATTAA